jgi:hypothetical protein
MSLKELKNVVPSHGVKSFTEIKLEEERWYFALVKSSRKVSHIHEPVVDTFFYEGALGI